MFHNPYNTPIGLYSDNNVFDAFNHQTKSIINHSDATNKGLTNYNEPPQKPQSLNDVNSLSMRMLNSALNASEGTNGITKIFSYNI